MTRAPTPADKVWTLGVLAMVWCRSGEARRGVEALEQVDSALHTAGMQGDWFSLFLGAGYLLAGEYDKAQRHLVEILEEAKNRGKGIEIGPSHWLLAEVVVASDDSAEGRSRAAHHFESAIACLREIGAENHLAHAYAGYGRLHKRQGRVPEAQDCLTRALEIFERLGTLIEPEKVRAELAELPAT